MIPAFLVTKFGPTLSKVIFFGGILLAIVLLGLGIYLVGRGDGKSGEVAGELKREVQVQSAVTNADTSAADARVKDATRTEQQKEELNAALQSSDDPDRRRAQRGCVILRQQGRNTSGIPACR